MNHLESNPENITETGTGADNTQGSTSTLYQKIKRNIFQWHRVLGLIVLVPTVFWTLSGIMHPFMSNWFRPSIAHEALEAHPIDTAKLQRNLPAILAQHEINQIRNFRIISFNGRQYYQVRMIDDRLDYFDTSTGTQLPDGEKAYSTFMARYLLSDTVAAVRSVELVTAFTDEYKPVNRLLPVYKVSFDRPDGMEVYVSTATSRMGTFNNKARKAFIHVFALFHTWSFLDGNNSLRVTAILFIAGIIFISALSGIIIYGLFWKKFSKQPIAVKGAGFFRRHHRRIGIFVSITTLTFSFSGMYHAFMQYTPDDRTRYVYASVFNMADIDIPVSSLPLNQASAGVSLVRMKDSTYYQIFDVSPDAMVTRYINTHSGKELPDGNTTYAIFLANHFIKMQRTRTSGTEAECCERIHFPITTAIRSTEPITHFTGEYGFINKLLPVVKVDYAVADETSYYIETASGCLAARINNSDRYEGFSFAFLHKYHGLGSLGKNFRDGVLTLAALGNLVVAMLGIILFLKTRAYSQ